MENDARIYVAGHRGLVGSAVVRALRCELLSEHLGLDTAALDDRAAFTRYREIARDNARRRARGEGQTALAFALDPATYPG